MPWIGEVPIEVSPDGNGRSLPAGMVSSPSKASDNPRNNVSVPMVTAIDGRPVRATRTPLRAPPTAPTSRAAAKQAQMFQPWCHRKPTVEPDSPNIEATDRSISPVMTMKVIGRAMIAR